MYVQRDSEYVINNELSTRREQESQRDESGEGSKFLGERPTKPKNRQRPRDIKIYNWH